MATFVLLHGASASAGTGTWWRPSCVTRPRRRRAGSPLRERQGRLPEYADAVVDAIGDRTDLIVVAQSLGGFTAPLVCERVPVKLVVLVAPMIPAPGEASADYWANTRYDEEEHERYDDEIAL
jgi:hypothetical protein